MSYRANDVLTLVLLMALGGFLIVLGYLGRSPGFMEAKWWLPVGIGTAIVLVSLANIGFVATQPARLRCPHCDEKIVPKVSGMSRHLRLSRLDED